MITDEEEGVASASEEQRWRRAAERLYVCLIALLDRTIRTGSSGPDYPDHQTIGLFWLAAVSLATRNCLNFWCLPKRFDGSRRTSRTRTTRIRTRTSSLTSPGLFPVAVGNRFRVSGHQADPVWPFRPNHCPPLI